MSWVTAGAFVTLIIAIAAFGWWASRAGRATERAAARDGAAAVRHRMDGVDAGPRPDDGGIDGFLRGGADRRD